MGGNVGYAADVTDGVCKRVATERGALAAEATRLPDAIERLQGEADRLLVSLAPLTGSAKQRADERLAQTCRELEELQQHRKQTERQLAALRDAEANTRWVTEVLEDFDALWKAMTTENRRRLVAALIDSVVVDERAGTMRIRFAEVLPAARAEGACA